MERYWVVPGRHGPRWIVPENPRDGMAVLAHWRPYGLISRLKWAALTAAYRAGQLGRVPGISGLGIAGAGTADWGHLGWRGAAPPVPSIYIGTPGPAQKAVATLVADGAAVAVAKAPLGPLAASGILHEAAMLERLATEKPGMAPRLLHTDRDAGIGVQEAVMGRPCGRRLGAAHLGWLAGLRMTGAETSLAEWVGRFDPPQGCDVVRRALDAAADTTSLPAHWEHGDFAPWNLKWRGRGQIAALDWEEARPGGLPLLDLLHFDAMQSYLFASTPRLGRFSDLPAGISAYAGSWGVGAALWRKLRLFYLARAWIGRSRAGESDHAAYLAGRIAPLRAEAP